MIAFTRPSIFMFAIVATVGPVTAQNDDLASGERLYQENCASCHGVDLEGQADWRVQMPNGRLPAPPHDASGHTWHHSDRLLFTIVKQGTAALVGNGYESDMPGFDGMLSDAGIVAVLSYIKSTWPARNRDMQETITQADVEAQE